MEEKLYLGVDCQRNLHFILLYYYATIFLKNATN